MRICVLHSSYEGSGLGALEEVDDVPPQPQAFTDQHTFENKWIRKSHAIKDIKAAVAEGYDFYFNFLWGTPDDPVSGAKESRYFESLALPSCGVRSCERFMTKNDFYANARLRGSPPVPGTETFPLFVKPANGCASQMIDEKSLCHDEAELKGTLGRINKALYENRINRAKNLGIADREAYANSYDPESRSSDDIVVQEFIEGVDMTCTVIQMGQACLALTPFVYKTKAKATKGNFLTFDLKHDDDTSIELLKKKDDPALFERIQRVAINAFMASGCRTSNMGCDVDLRVRSDGAAFAIEVNPMPAAFMPTGAFQDLPIIHSLPGGHRAVINIFIANELQSDILINRSSLVSQVYDNMAPTYDVNAKTTEIPKVTQRIVSEFDFSGTVFDLGCGTGLFGRLLREAQSSLPPRAKSTLLGFDISHGMLKVCEQHGAYNSVHIDTMETALINFARYAEKVDHVVFLSSALLISPEVFSFILVLCFTLANKSITFTVDHITESYNRRVVENGYPHMQGTDHLKAVEAFGEPPGWRLKRGERETFWTSPNTGDLVYATCFRFEREADASRDIMFYKEELPN
ncbi:2-C-methyl-D-erythritol 2,4-cyclodiphosphate synthase [Nemania sp. FL0916]|nr:2-C-methyl-D-erythritol 2,4-cyclodiphosphate synthase [Nemania sp. FL0916]